MQDFYNPEQLKEDIELKSIILNTAIDVQSVIQILVANGVMTKEELNDMRDKVKNFPKYKSSIKYIEDMNKVAELYENDPQAYLRALFKAKMDGKIK